MTCTYCEGPFDPIRSHQHFCSPQCRKAHWRVNNPEKHRASNKGYVRKPKAILTDLIQGY